MKTHTYDMLDRERRVSTSDNEDSDQDESTEFLCHRVLREVGNFPFSNVPHDKKLEMSKRLDPDATNGSDWRFLAQLLKISPVDISWFASIQNKPYGSNAYKILSEFKGTVEEIVLALEHMKRADVLRILAEDIEGIKRLHSESIQPVQAVENAEPESVSMGLRSHQVAYQSGHGLSENKKLRHSAEPMEIDSLLSNNAPQTQAINKMVLEDLNAENVMDSMDVNVSASFNEAIDLSSFQSGLSSMIDEERPVPVDVGIMRRYELESASAGLHVAAEEEVMTSPTSNNNSPNFNGHISPASRPSRRQPRGQDFIRQPAIPEHEEEGEEQLAFLKYKKNNLKTSGGGIVYERKPKEITQPIAKISSYGIQAETQRLPPFREAFFDCHTSHHNAHYEEGGAFGRNTLPKSAKEERAFLQKKIHKDSEIGAPHAAMGDHNLSQSEPHNKKPNQFKRDDRDIKVFISYTRDSKDHCQQVFKLAMTLKLNGFTVVLDRRLTYDSLVSAQDVQGWLDGNFTDAHVVVLCISPLYKRITECHPNEVEQWSQHTLNTRYIHRLVTVTIRNNHCRNERFIPVMMDSARKSDIPVILQNTLCYHWRKDWQDLFYRLSMPARVIQEAIQQMQSMNSSSPASPGSPKTPMQAMPSPAAYHDHMGMPPSTNNTPNQQNVTALVHTPSSPKPAILVHKYHQDGL